MLEGQSIGSLVGHLARGSVWVVEDYLDRSVPDPGEVGVQSAAAYFTTVGDTLTEADHAAIRTRGADVAASGHPRVVEQLSGAIDRLAARLPGEPSDRAIAVFGGTVMRLDDYLVTRIVEQVVHLDDLARSLGIGTWVNPPGAEELVVACGADIGRARRGDRAMVRALFRGDVAGVLPVL